MFTKEDHKVIDNILESRWITFEQLLEEAFAQ
jgi:hypothetical protein